jgi:4-oxalocrotonate tautomerase
MPVVIVEMWQGRNEDQKSKLIKGITKAFADIGVPANALHIIIHDVPKCNWGTGGEPASKTSP